MEKFDVAVIGGGAAGCMAAIQAVERSKNIVLIEKNNDIGNKILLTGNKRGNITNLAGLDTFIEKYRNGKFLLNSFSRFFNHDLVEFFESNGLKLKVERGQRVYPASDKAEDIVRVLTRLLKRDKLAIRFKTPVTRISRTDGIFCINAGKQEIAASKVIIACGGKSFPNTGSTGDGYTWAENFGHSIVEPLPGLCGIETGKVFNDWIGITLKNVAITGFCGKKKIAEEFGEILFTHYGISGPAVLNISADLSEHFSKGSMTVSLNLKPALDIQKLDGRLQREFSQSPNKQLNNILPALIPQSMVERFLQLCRVPGERPAHSVIKAERRAIADLFMHITFTVKKMKSFNDSMVTRGGVNVKEINPATMESRIVKNLFFAGEVVDVDGKTGGYNLQAAFTMGYVAGSSI